LYWWGWEEWGKQMFRIVYTKLFKKKVVKTYTMKLEGDKPWEDVA